MQLADLIIKDLKKKNINVFFGIQGGACARLIDSIIRNKCEYIPVLNEQSAGYAAHGYYMATGKTAGCVFTTGPGLTNGLSGLAACFFDNVPLVTLVGQVNTKLNLAKKFKTKMVGFQEVQHLDLLDKISDSTYKINSGKKYLNSRSKILNECNNKSIALEVNDDTQREKIILIKKTKKIDKNKIKKKLKIPSSIFINSQKPVIILGSGAKKLLEDNKVIKKVSNLRIPKVLSWGGQRFQKHLKSEGLFGRHSKGVGNKIILNSDLVIAVGCSLLQHQTGKIAKKFAPNAKIIFVNTSKNEINRAKYFFGKRFYGVEADALDFLKEVIKKRSFLTLSKKLNLDNIDNNKVKIIPPIKIIHKFLSSVSKDYIVFSDAGATLSWTYQAANLLKHPPEIYTSFNLHSMGYANCAAIGAANKKKKILVIIGDGSIPMNSQELIHCKNKNIKFLILDNEGYGIIRQTQKDFYKSSFLGSDFRDKSAHLPKFSVEKILKSFELKTSIINEKQIENFNLKKFLLFKNSSALICKINYFHRVEEDI